MSFCNWLFHLWHSYRKTKVICLVVYLKTQGRIVRWSYRCFLFDLEPCKIELNVSLSVNVQPQLWTCFKTQSFVLSRLIRLMEEIMSEKENKTIVFVETKRRCDELTRKMRRDGYVGFSIYSPLGKGKQTCAKSGGCGFHR